MLFFSMLSINAVQRLSIAFAVRYAGTGVKHVLDLVVLVYKKGESLNLLRLQAFVAEGMGFEPM